MKKLILTIALALSGFISKAQTREMATADEYFDKKSYANAANYYNQVLTNDTANVKALRRMGYCTMSLPGQVQNAAKYFIRAINVNPKDPVSNYYLGVIYTDMAKEAKDKTAKSDFKATAAKYLNSAVSYGSEDAKSAINDLNGI